MRVFLLALALLSSPALFAALFSTFPVGISLVTGNGLPVVAVDPRGNGNALAAWVDQTNNIQASFFLSSTGVWSFPVIIGVSSGSPQVGMDTNGNGLIIWNNGNNLQIESVFFSGTTLTFTFPIQISAGGTNQLPQLAMAANGNALAVWLNSTSFFSPLVQAAEFNRITRVWSFPIQISVQPAVSAQVAIDNNNGNGVAIWDNLISGQIETAVLIRQ